MSKEYAMNTQSQQQGDEIATGGSGEFRNESCDDSTSRNRVTKLIKKRPEGRPRNYQTAAERQRAYRQRVKGNVKRRRMGKTDAARARAYRQRVKQAKRADPKLTEPVEPLAGEYDVLVIDPQPLSHHVVPGWRCPVRL